MSARYIGLVVSFAAVFALSLPAASPPVVSNVRSQQRAGTKLVDITYDLADPDSTQIAVSILVSTNAGASYSLPASSFTGNIGINQSPGLNKKITWDAGTDWPGKFSANVRFRVTADDLNTPPAPSGMAAIPAGNFTMGDVMGDGDTYGTPTHTVYVSAFYMDRCEVTKGQWDGVYTWAVTHGYSFDYVGSGKAANHPVQTVDWYDCVKWCNARSQQEGRTPAYYTDAAMTLVYKTGQIAPYVRWNAGYRLPTEAEWEKAARGGASGQRFPWGNTISWGQANYYAYPLSAGGYAYDVNPTSGYHPSYQAGGSPYTSPVGAFAPNGYGLYDMAGNVWEWCWDWWGSYSSASQIDPRGPASGSYRVFRGGGWSLNTRGCRVAGRYDFYPGSRGSGIGFRSVLASGQ